jgi:dihydroflavonol-4-reductase
MAYDRSKAEALSFSLQFATQNTLEVLSLCPTSVIGPFDFEPSLSGQMFLDLYHQKVPLLVAGGFDWCDVRDIAGAAVSALQSGRSGEAYLLPGRYATLLEMAQIAGDITGKSMPTRVAPDALLRFGAPFVAAWANLFGKHPLYTNEALDTVRDGSKYISGKKAAQELGYSARPLETTIADTYQWFEQNGYL